MPAAIASTRRPDVETYNALLEGVVRALVQRDDDMFYAFMGMRDRMLKNGIRPNKTTYKHFCEGYVKLKDDIDYALGAYESLRKTAVVGGTKLLEKSQLSNMLRKSAGSRRRGATGVERGWRGGDWSRPSKLLLTLQPLQSSLPTVSTTIGMHNHQFLVLFSIPESAMFSD